MNRLIIERLDMGFVVDNQTELSTQRYGYGDNDIEEVVKDISKFLGVVLEINKNQGG